MQGFFYTMLILSIFGAIIGRDNVWARLFYNHDPATLMKTGNDYNKIQIAVKYQSTKSISVKVKFLGNPAQQLAKDIEIVTRGNILAETMEGYSYREILEDLTPEQIKDINDMRSFLK